MALLGKMPLLVGCEAQLQVLASARPQLPRSLLAVGLAYVQPLTGELVAQCWGAPSVGQNHDGASTSKVALDCILIGSS